MMGLSGYFDIISETINHKGGFCTFTSEFFKLKKPIKSFEVSLWFYTFSHGIGSTIRVFINGEKIKSPEQFFKYIFDLVGVQFTEDMYRQIMEYLHPCRYLFWPFAESVSICNAYHKVLTTLEDYSQSFGNYYFCLQSNTKIHTFRECLKWWFFFSMLITFEQLTKDPDDEFDTFYEMLCFSIYHSFPDLMKVLESIGHKDYETLRYYRGGYQFICFNQALTFSL